MAEDIKCSKCGSKQFVANKKGFSGKKAVVGALATGGIGVLAGTIGSNKVKITCLNCGHVYDPAEKRGLSAPKELTPSQLVTRRKVNKISLTIFLLILIFWIIIIATK